MKVTQSIKPHQRTTTFAALCLACTLAFASQAPAQQSPSPAATLNDLGPEGNILAQRVGLWDLTETVWASPTSAPVVTRGLIAERRLMGTLLQEIIRQPDTPEKDAVKRTDLLAYSRLEGRWAYISFDTRAPVGLMPAWSSGRGDATSITVVFTPFAVPTSGAQSPFLKSGPQATGTPSDNALIGQFIQMDQTIHFDSPNHDTKDQYFTLSDGTATRWLAHRYAYTRRP